MYFLYLYFNLYFNLYFDLYLYLYLRDHTVTRSTRLLLSSIAFQLTEDEGYLEEGREGESVDRPEQEQGEYLQVLSPATRNNFLSLCH